MPVGEIEVTECEMVNQFVGSREELPQFTRGYGLAFGYAERKAMGMALVDRALRAEEYGEEVVSPAQQEEFVLMHCDNVEAGGFVSHLKLPHYVDFQSELELIRKLRRPGVAESAQPTDQEKRACARRRPRCPDPAAAQMPLPYGWGTGGMQVTAAILGADDVLKVIDQGADDTTNAVSIRRFFARTAGVATTERTPEATVIQTRHRIPETALSGEQIMVYQVPIPEPLRFIEPSEAETRTMHALDDYGVMHVKLYEDIATFGHIATSYAYPVTVDERYVMDPSPIPKFDNPKLDMSPALMLFGAGREKRLYAVPPFTRVASLDFEDHPFEVQRWEESCAFCGSHESYLDELIVDDRGGKRFVCSDTDYCTQRRACQEEGEDAQ